MDDDDEQQAKALNGRSKVAVRQMDIDDLPVVFHLGEKLFTASENPTLYRTWDEYEVIALFQGDSEFCIVAEVEDRIVGFALGTTIEKNNSAWKYGHLVWLGIDSRYQRLGIATKLFHHFQQLMLENGVRMLLVDTEADNHTALDFFKKMGFNNPARHIYLTLNLTQQQRLYREHQGLKKPPGKRNGIENA